MDSLYRIDAEFQYDLAKAKWRKRLELADPCFLTYHRLRPSASVEIHFELLTCPFQTKAGDRFV